jgi:hypothetical protein
MLEGVYPNLQLMALRYIETTWNPSYPLSSLSTCIANLQLRTWPTHTFPLQSLALEQSIKEMVRILAFKVCQEGQLALRRTPPVVSAHPRRRRRRNPKAVSIPLVKTILLSSLSLLNMLLLLLLSQLKC